MRRKDDNISERIVHFSKNLKTLKVDGVIFLNMSNIRYLSGFTGSEGILLVGSDEATLFVDGRYTVQADRETEGVQIKECPDKIEAVSRAVRESKCRRIGFEADAITLAQFNQLTRKIPKQRLIALTDELRMLRAYKDETEISFLRKAANISSSAMRSVISRVKPGWTEKELAWQLETEARKRGADGIAFETIVAAGPNAALPHARATDRKIKKGDFVVMDFGVRYKGYGSDETCTIAFGKLTDRQKNAYQAVKDAHDCALKAVVAGVSAAEIDKKVRDVFGEKYIPFFVHGTGHGVGLECHEAPRLSPVSRDILEPGMVFTVEPGLYYPGQWGIRIEDSVLLKENSCEKLTKVDKKLTIIE